MSERKVEKEKEDPTDKPQGKKQDTKAKKSSARKESAKVESEVPEIEDTTSDDEE